MTDQVTEYFTRVVPAWLSGAVLLVAVLMAAPPALAQVQGDAPRVVHDEDAGISYYENVLSVKINSGAVRAIEAVTNNRGMVVARENGAVSTGLAAVDQLNQRFGAVEMRRIFRPAGRFEERHRAFGLHQWYEIRFEDGADVRRAVRAYGQTADISTAELQYEKAFVDGYEPGESEVHTVEVPSARASSSILDITDDPLYGDQWHYHNTGQEPPGGTPDADIDLPEAHDHQTGDPSVVVSVHDGGIDVDHEDLAANLWVNEGEIPGNGIDDDENGYVDDVHGYNFVNDTGNISPDDHGTHVAGTIAAVNNNGTGVAGVAGGDGTEGSGVRVMSAQVFAGFGSGGFPESYTYSADMGAVISQNSWGYTSAGVVEDAVLDGIDYYIANAGTETDAPMQGGLVIFAAGNDNDDGDWYPAFYEPTVAVASSGIDDQKAGYSNYGDWVDITAPGGNGLPYDENDVLSTLTSNGYGYIAGTSMACPHASGVASLITSAALGSTNDYVRDILEEGTDNIDDINPGFEGLLGTGRINAFLALQLTEEDDGIAPEVITDLTVVDTGPITADLEWTAPAAGEASDAAQLAMPSSYDLRYSTEPIEDEADFDNAEQVQGVPGPSDPGETEEFTVEGLTPSTEYFFAIRTSDIFGNTSEISNVASGTTAGAPVIAFDPDEVEHTLSVGESGEDMMQVLNPGEGVLSFTITGIGYPGSEITDPIEGIEQASIRTGPLPLHWQELEAQRPEDRFSPSELSFRAEEGAVQGTSLEADGDDPFAGLLEEIGVTGHGVDVFGAGTDFVQFDLGLPEEMVVVGSLGDTFAGNFIAGNDEELYWIDNTDNQLKTYHLEDGTVDVIGPLNPVGSSSEGWTDMETDPTSGTTYVTTHDAGINRLYELDPVNAELEFVGEFSDGGINIAFAIDGTGQGYGHNISTDEIHLVDLETAESEVLGPTGINANFAQSMTYDATTDRVLMAAYEGSTAPMPGSLREVDTATGNTTLIGPIGPSGEANEIAMFATPGQPVQWLTVEPLEGEVEVGTSEDLSLFFETTFEEEDDLIGGLSYFASVQFETNDPSQPTAEYPVTLVVEGTPEFVSDDVVDFGNTFSGTTVTTTLEVTNGGDAILQVGSLEVDNEAFEVHNGPFVLNPGESTQIGLSFSPDASEVFEGTLTLTTNIGDIEVDLVGEGAPFISMSPPEVDEELDAGETTEVTVSITNEFVEELPLSLFIRAVAGENQAFQPQLENEELVRYWEIANMQPSGSATDKEISMEAAPSSSERSEGGEVRAFADLLDETEVIGFANDVLGGNIVSFDLGVPEELTVLDASVDSYAGNFTFGNNEEVYFIDNADNHLKTYSLEDGTIEEVGELNPVGTVDEGWTDLETDFTDGTTYVTTAEVAGTVWTSRLYELNPFAPELTLVGEFDGLAIAFAIDDEGNGFVHEITNDELLSIDLETAETEVIGPTGITANFAQSMTYDHETDQLLMAAMHGDAFLCGVFGICDNDLRFVDRETGNTLPIGFLGDGTGEMGWFATEGEGIQWLTLNFHEVTLQPGATVDLLLDIDATDLIEGNYEAEVNIVGEQLQGQPSETLPVSLFVDGEPEIWLSDAEFDFGEVFENGTSAKEMVTVRNVGTADMHITDVSIDSEHFDFEGDTEFTLVPEESKVFEVWFNPQAVGEFTATLSFTGDEGINGGVELSGEGIPAPEIAVDPEGFEHQAYVGQIQEHTLELSNVGGNPLEWEAVIGVVENQANDDLDLLLEEDFSGDFPPEGWTRAGANDGENWRQSQSSEAGGEAPEAEFYWSPSTVGLQRLITPAIDTSPYGEIVLNFRHYINMFASAPLIDMIGVQTSSDGGETWTTVETWDPVDMPATMETIVIDNDDVGSPEFQVAWVFEGDSFDINWWDMDDVQIWGELNWLTVAPEEGTIDADESEDLTLTVDATDMAEGTHELGVIIHTNDPVTPVTFVPFTLHVIETLSVSAEPEEDDEEVHPNEVFTVPVTVQSMDDLEVYAYEFDLEFDADLLEAQDVITDGTLSEDISVEFNITDGKVQVAGFDGDGEGTELMSGPALFQIEGEGTLAYVEFQAKEMLGDTELEFTKLMFNEGMPPATPHNGTVDVVPLYGDVALNLEVTSFDASLVLQHVVDLVDLNDAQLTAADVNDSGSVTAFDAAYIQRYVVGLIDCFPVKEDCETTLDVLAANATTGNGSSSSSTTASALLSWGEVEVDQSTDVSYLPLVISDTEGPVTSVTLTTPLDENLVSVEEVRSSLPEGWMMAHNVDDDGVLRLAMSGTTPLQDGRLADVALKWQEPDAQMNLVGEVAINDEAAMQIDAEVGSIPDEFALGANYPNPFTSGTTLTYELPAAVHVRVVVYNVLGQRVAVLVDEEKPAGRHEVVWDGRTDAGIHVGSGVYLYQIQAGDFVGSDRMTIVR